MALAAVPLATHREDFYAGTRSSQLVEHGKCCRLAKKWLLNTHRSLSFNRTQTSEIIAPTWLPNHFKWGPTQWPLGWCEAIQRREIDCGVFAAFAELIFQDVNLEVYRGQILLDQPRTMTEQWSANWSHIPMSFPWFGACEVYHEVVAVTTNGHDIRVYDPTEAVWVGPRLGFGFNKTIGISIDSPQVFDWGAYEVGLGKWLRLERKDRFQ
jgi:hypothetical protein